MNLVRKIKKHIGISKTNQVKFPGNIDYSNKYIFVHIPKNAGTSVYRALGFTHTFHATALEYRNALSKTYDDFFSFCFVRNPFDRFLSLYNYARLDESYYHSAINPSKTIYGKHLDYDILVNASLEQAADLLLEGKLRHDNAWNHWRPQMDWILDEENNVIVNYIGRVEDIRMDFQNVCNILKLPAGNELSLLNTSNNKKTDYRQLITSTMREKLEFYYKADFDFLGYSFENNCGFKNNR